ncbi:MAG: zinc ribbon domain-containing protein [Candidatus Heimdallarchaeum endolithica]|uniref:Zinc ribbon domain-containing protein n=1 Tax=Candidatus Heimdallarchaeum endolithica TaxID=2876572 RepID=A0A9Y1BU25_9ARCH|nr:MAG: zinc ribbon domain-containing protein [Candidatus Heimdallarchaeum endolithica]
MHQNTAQSRLSIIKNKIASSSKALGIIYIIIALSEFISYLFLYTGFSLFIKFLNFDYFLVSLFLVSIFSIVLVIFRYIFFFKLAGGFNDLSTELSFYYNFHTNSAKDVSKYIKVSMFSEMIIAFISPFLFLLLFFLPSFSFILLILILLPFIFLTLGFKVLSSTFDQLQQMNLFYDQFTNWLLYSRYIIIVSVFSSVFGTIKMTSAISEGLLTGYFDTSFLIWFLIASISALLGYIFFVGGFYALSNDAKKIGFTGGTAGMQNSFVHPTNLRTGNLNPSMSEEVVYADNETKIAFKKNPASGNPKSMVLEVRDKKIDQVNPLNAKRNTYRNAIPNRPLFKYCPNCGFQNDIDARFCSNCGKSFVNQ